MSEIVDHLAVDYRSMVSFWVILFRHICEWCGVYMNYFNGNMDTIYPTRFCDDHCLDPGVVREFEPLWRGGVEG